MVKGLHKSFQDYLSKLKKPYQPITTTSRLLSACKYPKTLSLDLRSPPQPSSSSAATLADVDRFLSENFSSLYNDVKASDRFLVDEEERSSTSNPTVDGVAVVTMSMDPCKDFRRSMEEMVLTREGDVEGCGALDWEYLEELLFCYLELNEKKLHGLVLRAFADLVVTLQCR
ncbi:hypothetical protein QJS04_geneDACA005481 [Acorus gramineus]|uniref:Transcription repressor n=1 Tax=Acorus gramineus TaxID=55184 RepID=A0AAV9A4N8_ACOGR|nr:hypothetical protein QJS04_geneDACA005481 [Acorus gramineus]